MAGYAKVFSDIVHSTVWREDVYTKVVWITMLVMADRHGLVMASIPGLADAAKVSIDQCLDALKVLSSPDKYSRTKDYDGRRIDPVDGGWLLLNYDKFRARKDDEEQRIRTVERVRRHRQKLAESIKSGVVTENVTVTPSNPIASATASANSVLNTKDAKASSRFVKPTIPEITEYCKKRGNQIDPVHFFDYYESNGWRVGKNPMKNWQATVRTWEANHGVRNGAHQQDTRSRAKKFSDKLDDIARRDIEKNGFTDKLD